MLIIDVGVAPGMMVDGYNHIIEKRERILNVIIWKKIWKKRKCFLQYVKENCSCIACTRSKFIFIP